MALIRNLTAVSWSTVLTSRGQVNAYSIQFLRKFD